MSMATSEEIKRWRDQKEYTRDNFMTDEEKVYINNCITLLMHTVSIYAEEFDKLETIEEFYGNSYDDEEGLPNSKMNLLNSAIEGMVSQLVDKNLQTSVKGVGPEDEQFAAVVRTGANWIIRNNDMFKKLSLYARRYVKFGYAWIKPVFDPSYAGDFGISKIMIPPINSVFVDTNVTDVTRLEEASFIAETIMVDRRYVIENYGLDKASALDYGQNEFRDNGVFKSKFTPQAQDDSIVIIQWWSKAEGKLRLQEFSSCGVLIFDSHKPGDRKTNQKDSGIKRKSFYKYVGDKYPYFLDVKYSVEGMLLGFGDGWLLIPLQKTINELYDKIMIQMRPHLIAVDNMSDIDIESFNENSFEPVYFDGAQVSGRDPVKYIPWGTITNDMFQLIDMIHLEAQRVIRFSNTMIGQGQAETATEAAIQQQQGNSHIDHEKTKLEHTMADVIKYCIGMMMELSKSGKSLRINNDKDEYEWVDFRQFAKVPVQIPATAEYTKQYTTANPGVEPPKYQTVEENGKTITKCIELDLDISVGSGLPKNPAFLWTMIEKLAQLMVIDTDEQQPVPKPAINWAEIRDFMKNILGIPIKDDDQMKKFVETMNKLKVQQMQKVKGAGSITPNQNIAPGPGGMGGNQPEEQPGTQNLTAGGGMQQSMQQETMGQSGGMPNG
jgi:hypothetical protein